MPSSVVKYGTVLIVGALAVVGCADEPGATDPVPPVAMAEGDGGAHIASITDLVTVDVGGDALTFWPYTGRTPTIGDAADPINLILFGDADPRVLRARLMGLSGDRTAFGLPDAFPFNCTWSDAIGGTQAVYAEETGWSGSVIQLQCGEYETLRFHLRLFRVGDVTLANAHLDLRIPGTTGHDAISWEIPQLIATLDFQRLGAVVSASPVITQAPTYRSIQAPVFAGLPLDLKGLLLGLAGLPPSVTPTGDLLNDGVASILQVPPGPAGDGGTVISRQIVEIQFDQFIPRPFCEGDGEEIILVQGPVTLEQQVIQTASGTFVSSYHAKGYLDIQQVAPVPSEPYRALVNQHGRAVMTDGEDMVNDIQLQMEIRPGGGERGQLRLNVRIGPDGVGEVSGSASCKE
ncbi:MAG TPA: hypothetical protein VK858_15055 [Longimicrobiales bacterium]|nr:hypothetical protein [Longimicrobiales bacterium]